MQKHISFFFWQLLRNDYLRYLIVLLRYYFFKIFYKFQELKSPYSITNTNKYNRSALNSLRTECFYNRIRYLHGIMMSLEYLNKDAEILLIGSRSENELLYLKSYGFQNITCIDILSYSPRIKCMDMHNLIFRKNKFDIVICGWTMVYSQNEKKCADEIIRVSKNKSIILLGYAKRSGKQINSSESAIVPKKNANSAKQILKLFNGNIERCIFLYDAELDNLSKKKMQNIAGHTSSNILTIFQLKK